MLRSTPLVPLMLILAATRASGQSAGDTACTVPAESAALIKGATRVPAPETVRAVRSMDEVREERLRRTRELLHEHPNDFWIAREVINATHLGRAVSPDEVIQEFEARYRAQPEDMASAYLFAAAITGKDTPRALSILTKLTQKHPEFAFPYATLTNIFNSANFRDTVKRQTAGEAFLRLCPNAAEARMIAIQVSPSPRMKEFAVALRERIAGKTDTTSISLLPTLWHVELQNASIPEQAALRERITAELKQVEALDRNEYPTLAFVVTEGYRLTGQVDLQKQANAASNSGSAASVSAYFNARNEFYRTNPSSADPAKKAEYSRRLLKFTDEWLAKFPGIEYAALDRLRALDDIPETTSDTILAAGEKVLANSSNSSTSPLQVGEAWARRDIAIDRVPALVQRGLDAIKAQQARMAQMNDSDLTRGSDRELMEQSMRWTENSIAWGTLVRVYTRMGKIGEAKQTLAVWETELGQRRQQAQELQKAHAADKAPIDRSNANAMRKRNMEDSLIVSLPAAESQLSLAQAQIAEAEGHKVDALAYYQAALRVKVVRDVSKLPEAIRAHVLWTELGGTDAGWETWLGSLKTPTSNIVAGLSSSVGRWNAVDRRMPEFSLQDQHGATWTLAKMQGKTTLINIWATWCAPCRVELPHLQKLYDRVKAREDIQIITLNIDENVSLIAPFLQENKFTFPVLVAKPFVEAFNGPTSIPTNWILDRAANLRNETVGFAANGDGETWITETLSQIEKMRAGN